LLTEQNGGKSTANRAGQQACCIRELLPQQHSYDTFADADSIGLEQL
jgi:hypothetical protein